LDTVKEKKKHKRPSAGQRIHARRLKQEARKANVPENLPRKKAPSA
jgi:hypothetical protein